MVAEVHLAQTLGQLRLLMEKLYRRNPREWRKAGHPSLETAVGQLFSAKPRPPLTELGPWRRADAIQLAFDDAYEGDRVLAFVAGLLDMTLASYGDKTEFFLLDELDPQKLYNCARNFEIAAWKLGHDRDSQGRLFLLSNESSGPLRNLSYERLFGKLIAQQDIMALVVTDRTNRRIKNMLWSVASVVFLPI